MRRILIGLCLLTAATWAHGQSSPGQYTWEEFSKRIKASEAISPLGPEFAGEQVSLSNGALSFSATDVSLPGNDKLAVAFSRSYSVFSRKDYGDLGMLADWTVNVPSVSAVLAPNWTLGYSQTESRCSVNELPIANTPFRATDFWQGLQIEIPGVTSGELLRTKPTTTTPSTGATYYWMTNEQVHVSCLASIKNGTGEGFLAITPDGTRYWFDWMGQTPEAPSKALISQPGGSRVMQTLLRRKNYLYATRVEDRFGNYVTYTYSNAWNAPGQLTQIQASDGRTLAVSYTNGLVSSVSDGARTWSYAYATTTSGRRTLTGVTLPDTSAWSINFSAFTNAEIRYNEAPPGGEILRTCTMNEMPVNGSTTFTGTITHPAGGSGSFVVGIQEHGRSYVPVACYNILLQGPNYSPLSNDKNDDQNLYATSAYSLTLKQKSVSGPGITSAAWNYAYVPNFSLYFYPGTTRDYPVCDTANYDCSLPPCTSEDCAKSSITTVTGPGGEWIRYFHGNTYFYNEGKLLRVDAGTSETNVLKRVTHTYDLSRVDQVYPASFGYSNRLSGDGFSSSVHRPLIRTTTDQQGVRFMYQIDAFDAFARPLQVTRATSAAPPAPPPVSTNPEPPAEIVPPILTAPGTASQGTAISLTWTAVAGATQYILERKQGTGLYSTNYSGPNTSATPLMHTSGTTKFRVKACNGSLCSGYSAERTVSVSGSGGPGGGGGVEP